MSTTRALVIGIDGYTGRRRVDGQAFGSLRGSVNDALAFDRYLRDRLHVPRERIERLLEPAIRPLDPVTRAGGDRARRPTYRNLVAGFERLICRTAPGDAGIIFFSGHGARAATMIPDAKGADGIDECLVPVDAAEPDGGYLRDVEMAVLLQRLVARGCRVTLILDCCFAAGATRGPVAVRGIAGVDRGERPEGSRVAAVSALAAHWQRRRGRHAYADRCWTFEPEGYVCLAACRATESAYEYPFDGHAFHGTFSHSLLATLNGGGGEGSYRVLMDRVTARVRQRFEHQTPTLEGDLDRLVWGADSQHPPPSGVLVLTIDPLARRLRLGAGTVHGLGVGDRLLPASCDRTSQNRTHGADPAPRRVRPDRLAAIRVASVGTVESIAVADARTLACLAPGDRVAVVEPGSAPVLRVAALTPEPKSLLAALERGCRDTPSMLAWVGTSAAGPRAAPLTDARASDVQIVRDDRDDLHVLDPAGACIPHLGRPLSASVAGSACELLRRLRHLYRFRAVAALINPNPPPYLSPGLEVTLDRSAPVAPLAVLRLPVATLPGAPPPRVLQTADAEGSVARRSAPASVQVGEGLVLRIHNRTTMTLEVAVLDLQPDWGIAQIAPSARAGSSQPLGPGQEWAVRLRAALPPGIVRGRDTIKVLATLDPTRFRWLELPALVSPLGSSPWARQRSDVEPNTAFERFLVSRVNPRGCARTDEAPDAGLDWLAETVSMEVRAECPVDLNPSAPMVSNASRRTIKGAALGP